MTDLVSNRLISKFTIYFKLIADEFCIKEDTVELVSNTLIYVERNAETKLILTSSKQYNQSDGAPY